MSAITAITAPAKHPNRRSLFVDGEFVAEVSAEIVEQLRLKVGDAADPADLARILEREEEVRARERCLRWLEVRARSRRELQERLRQAGFAPAVAERVLARLAQAGLVNDAAFAQALVHDRLRGGGLGRRRLRAELAKRGVERDQIEATLSGTDAAGEAETCRQLALRQAFRYRRLPRAAARRRLSGYLARRGFSAQDVFQAVDEALPDEPEAGG